MTSLKTYPDGTPFTGVIGRTTEESSPAWPEPPRAPDGAPNVIVFVLDDVGYGQLSSFGGLVETPVLDGVAANGLRYTNMHTTALCSPSRGAILTGRNHHSLGLAAITEVSTGYPGYNGVLPFDKGTLSEMLLPSGYNTFCVGKWHLSPPEHQTPAGPYDRWPIGRGFERFYGFLGGDTHQWYPDLIHDNHAVEPPTTPEEGYHLSVDLADKAIEFIQDAHVNAPDSPSFSTTRPAPAMRLTTCPRNGRTGTRASSTRAGTSTARSSTSASSTWASSRPERSYPRTIPTSRCGSRWDPMRSGCIPG